MDQVKAALEQPAQVERHLSQFAETALTLLSSYGLRALGAVLILIVGWFIARLVQGLMLRAGRKSRRVDTTIATFLASLVKYLIIIFSVVAAVASFGVQTASIVAILGAAGLAIGLALQGTLGHVAAGFMLILFRPFKVGDSIETAGVAGVVTEISLFQTEIRSADNVRIIIPNNAVWSGVTKNNSSHGTRRTEIEVPIPYGADASAALKTMMVIVAAETRVLKNPAPVIGVSRFMDANTRLVAQVWTTTADAGAVHIALSTAFREQLGRDGLLKV